MGSELLAAAVTNVRNELDALDDALSQVTSEVGSVSKQTRVSFKQEHEIIEETKRATAALAKQEANAHVI